MNPVNSFSFPFSRAQVRALLSPNAQKKEREAALDAFCDLYWQLNLVSRGADGGSELRLESTYTI